MYICEYSDSLIKSRLYAIQTYQTETLRLYVCEVRQPGTAESAIPRLFPAVADDVFHFAFKYMGAFGHPYRRGAALVGSRYANTSFRWMHTADRILVGYKGR
jgi:hypothetical protein